MTTKAKSNPLKKHYRIVWITESGFGFEDCIVAHEIIETPAQYAFNLLVDMLTYKSRYSA